MAVTECFYDYENYFHNLIRLEQDQGHVLVPVMRIATGSQVHWRDEVVLDKLSQSGNFLVFLLHNLDVLSKLNNSLSVRLKSKLCDDRQLNLCTQGKHNLLISDHAITSFLFGHMDPGLMWRRLKS